jgi:alpha/beta hydrolase fold
MSTQQQQALDAILRQGPLDLTADAETLRASFNALMAYVPVADDVDQQPTTIGGVSGIEVTIRGTDAANVILYFHGGVYVIGSAATSIPLVSDPARRTGAKAVTLHYRLAPEHPYPAAVQDAQAPARSNGTPRQSTRKLDGETLPRSRRPRSRACQRDRPPARSETERFDAGSDHSNQSSHGCPGMCPSGRAGRRHRR